MVGKVGTLRQKEAEGEWQMRLAEGGKAGGAGTGFSRLQGCKVAIIITR